MNVIAVILLLLLPHVVLLQLGLDVWKKLLAEPLKDVVVTLLLAELHKYAALRWKFYAIILRENCYFLV